jgi:hypothetical protein
VRRAGRGDPFRPFTTRSPAVTMMRPGAFTRNTRKTHVLLETLLSGVDQSTATSLRDGADGWNCVEIVCHLRDFELVWQERARLIIGQENPPLPVFDHEGMAIEKNYAAQQLDAVWAERTDLRRASLAMMESWSDEQWRRTGDHPEAGQITLLEMGMQMAFHDIDHAEQIARVLGKSAGFVEA